MQEVICQIKDERIENFHSYNKMTSETNFHTACDPDQIITWKTNVYIVTHLKNPTLNNEQATWIKLKTIKASVSVYNHRQSD